MYANIVNYFNRYTNDHFNNITVYSFPPVLETVWPGAKKWSQACYLEKDPFNGGSFNGNACRTLLRKTDLLQTLIEEDGCVMAAPYVQAFRSLADVVEACFGMILHNDFEDKIVIFKDTYDALPIKTITPKIHAIIHHVPEFCQEHQTGLGVHSEQASEAVHSKFKEVWKHYKVPKNNPIYMKQLYRAVTQFNSDRI